MAPSPAPTPEAVAERIRPAVDGAGLFLEDVKIVGPEQRSTVRVTVDLPEDEVGGVDLDQVAEVSRAISDALDAQDMFPGTYNLEVSSPGTSRPLTQARHFRRARTRLVTLDMIAGGTRAGRVAEVTDTAVVLSDDAGGTDEVPLADIRRGKVEVELKRMDEVDLGSEDEES